MQVLSGIGASEGVAIARIRRLRDRSTTQERVRDVGHVTYVEFERAIAQSKLEISQLQKTAHEKFGAEKAEIFEAHLQMLEDPEILETVARRVQEKNESAIPAYEAVVGEYRTMFENMDNPYLRERAADLKDVSDRVLRILRKESETNWDLSGDADIDAQGVILLARDLTPSITVGLDPRWVKGFITTEGGKTSHTAILARTLGIPAVVGVTALGLAHALDEIEDDTVVAIDGGLGKIWLQPDSDQTKVLEVRQAKATAVRAGLEKFRGLKSLSQDGHEITLAANLGSADDVALLDAADAEGVGLFRTEFLFMGRDAAPSEEAQFCVYRQLVEKNGDRHLSVVRTLDVGGDKAISYLGIEREDNPFLGLRGIRYCLSEKGLPVFRAQLRALWRASAFGRLAVMFPMIATVEELRAAKREWQQVRADLIAGGIAIGQNNRVPQVGMMIEVPSAVWMAKEFAREVDFFSIGTNDLVQYTLAVDRMNPTVAHLASAAHPAVLRQIGAVVEAARSTGIWVGICGEAAGDPELLPFFLALGLDELSMSPARVLKIRARLSQLDRVSSQAQAQAVLTADTTEAVLKILSTT